jgi:hypothetical protein
MLQQQSLATSLNFEFDQNFTFYTMFFGGKDLSMWLNTALGWTKISYDESAKHWSLQILSRRSAAL